MPIYDYVCSVCRHRLEVVHGMDGHGPGPCPVCGGAMRKAMVAPAIHFKGSGWAKKDRGSAARTKAAARADGNQPSTPATDGGSATETGHASSATTAGEGSSPTIAADPSPGPSPSLSRSPATKAVPVGDSD